jgi:NAD(P)-dependent dehydrogenase (short-subunit alcohol dehydrogenase family)
MVSESGGRLAGPIVITGGASGIGRAVAGELVAARTCDVVILDRSEATEEVARSLGAAATSAGPGVRESGAGATGDGPLVLARRVDVADQAAVRACFDDLAQVLPCLGGLVNNAGVLGRSATVEQAEAEDWVSVLGVNLLGPVWTTAAALPLLGKAPGRSASIVNVGSIVGPAGSPRHPAYAASKAGLLSLTVSLAKELAPRGIRVNAVCPGSVGGTGLFRETLGGRTPSVEDYALLMAGIPLRRLASPRDVAKAIVFLLSADAAHITGTTLTVDGGEGWRLPL